jgi:Ca2+-binding EF-hand superfamily protein
VLTGNELFVKVDRALSQLISLETQFQIKFEEQKKVIRCKPDFKVKNIFRLIDTNNTGFIDLKMLSKYMK